MPQAVLNLRRIEFLAGLPMNSAEELASIAELRRFPDGARVYTQGDQVPGIYVVVKGGLKVFRTDGRGRVQVLQFLKVGDCVGEVPVFDGAPTPSSAESHGETECWLIPSAPLRQIVHRHPEVAEMIIHHFTAKVRHLVTLVEFQETQEDLAQCIGASREAFSRALRLLTDLGLIQSTFPVVRILDLGKLQRYAKG